MASKIKHLSLLAWLLLGATLNLHAETLSLRLHGSNTLGAKLAPALLEAYARHPEAFTSSAERTEAMRPWLHSYNRWRPYSALSGKPLLSRPPRDTTCDNNLRVRFRFIRRGQSWHEYLDPFIPLTQVSERRP